MGMGVGGRFFAVLRWGAHTFDARLWFRHAVRGCRFVVLGSVTPHVWAASTVAGAAPEAGGLTDGD